MIVVVKVKQTVFLYTCNDNDSSEFECCEICTTHITSIVLVSPCMYHFLYIMFIIESGCASLYLSF